MPSRGKRYFVKCSRDATRAPRGGAGRRDRDVLRELIDVFGHSALADARDERVGLVGALVGNAHRRCH